MRKLWAWIKATLLVEGDASGLTVNLWHHWGDEDIVGLDLLGLL